jgi:hypothetical protein
MLSMASLPTIFKWNPETFAKRELLVNFSAPRSTYLPVRLTTVLKIYESFAKRELLVNFSAPRSTYLPVRLTTVLKIDFGFHRFAKDSLFFLTIRSRIWDMKTEETGHSFRKIPENGFG